jgi:hypothetical protein
LYIGLPLYQTILVPALYDPAGHNTRGQVGKGLVQGRQPALDER